MCPEANTFETAQMVGTVILTQNGQFGSGSEGDTLITLNDDDAGLWHRQWDRPGLRDPGQGERDFYPKTRFGRREHRAVIYNSIWV